jgi:hypothetical protein
MKLKHYPNYVESYELKETSVLLKRIAVGKVVYERLIPFKTAREAERYYERV